MEIGDGFDWLGGHSANQDASSRGSLWLFNPSLELDKGIERGVKRLNSHKIRNCHEKNFTISSHKIWQNIFLQNFLFSEEKILYITPGPPGLLKLG